MTVTSPLITVGQTGIYTYICQYLIYLNGYDLVILYYWTQGENKATI